MDDQKIIANLQFILNDLGLKMEQGFEFLAQEVHSLSDRIEKIEKLLTGNGDPEKGLIVRVDRLENSNKNIVRLCWGIGGAALTMVFAIITAVIVSVI